MVSLININIGEKELQKIASVCYDFKGNPNLKSLWDKKHLSLFEFVQIIFYVESSILVSRQLFRYRTATPMEKSLRHTKPSIVIPEDFKNIEFIENLYNDIEEGYDRLIKSGFSKEEARRIAPLSTETKFFFRMDMRNLYHLLEERTDTATQVDTRKIAFEMLEVLPTWIKEIYNLKVWR